MMTIKKELDKFTGTDHYHKHAFTSVFYTDGIKEMIKLCDAQWLIDFIAIRQNDIQQECKIKKINQSIQYWTFNKNENETWNLSCMCYGIKKGLIKLDFNFDISNFPLNSIKINVETNNGFQIILLPSES